MDSRSLGSRERANHSHRLDGTSSGRTSSNRATSCRCCRHVRHGVAGRSETPSDLTESKPCRNHDPTGDYRRIVTPANGLLSRIEDFGIAAWLRRGWQCCEPICVPDDALSRSGAESSTVALQGDHARKQSLYEIPVPFRRWKQRATPAMISALVDRPVSVAHPIPVASFVGRERSWPHSATLDDDQTRL